jgi:hypothetical protein
MIKPVIIGNPRPLTQADMALLREKRAEPRVERFRDSHHQVALLFAMGHRVQEIIEITGYSYNRIRTLHLDPAFQDLISRKRDKVEAAHIDANVAGTSMSLQGRQAALRHLLQHFEELDEVGETMGPKTALAIFEGLADRTGMGRHTTQTNVNVELASELEERIRKFNAMKQIEAGPAVQTSRAPPQAAVSAERVAQPLPFKRRM